MLENVKCITNNFPWDWFFFLLIPLLLLWWYHIYMVRKLLDQKNDDKLVDQIVHKVVEKNNLFIKNIEETIVSSISKSENTIVSNVVDSKREIIEKISLINHEGLIKEIIEKNHSLIINSEKSIISSISKSKLELLEKISLLDYQRIVNEISILIKNIEINTLTQLQNCNCKFDSARFYKLIPKISIKDDLTRVEGIGEKIQALLNKAGIYTYYQLANTNPKDIDVILDKAGVKFNTAVPDYWPKQAAWLRDGDEESLKRWQKEYDHGKEELRKEKLKQEQLKKEQLNKDGNKNL